VNVHQVKELIAGCFKQHEVLWEEMSNFEEFRERIAIAASVPEIFQAFAEFGYSQS